MVENIKQTGYDLGELALLYGKRGCCKKGTCIHKKARSAVSRIKELEEALRGVCQSIEYYNYVTEDKHTVDDYDICMKPAWVKADKVLNLKQ